MCEESPVSKSATKETKHAKGSETPTCHQQRTQQNRMRTGIFISKEIKRSMVNQGKTTPRVSPKVYLTTGANQPRIVITHIHEFRFDTGPQSGENMIPNNAMAFANSATQKDHPAFDIVHQVQTKLKIRSFIKPHQ